MTRQVCYVFFVVFFSQDQCIYLPAAVGDCCKRVERPPKRKSVELEMPSTYQKVQSLAVFELVVPGETEIVRLNKVT